MAGRGGYKHRARRLHGKRNQSLIQARESIRRVRNQFETKGQPWDPENNPAQMAALTHGARRLVSQSRFASY